jgi:signal transduction histidine kinase
VKKRTHEIEGKNIILLKQSNELSEVNSLLEERQQQIEEQNEILTEQAEKLIEANQLLKESKEEISIQNEELSRHRNNLEERTSELVSAKIKAEESDRLKTSFLANMSHEIRTPMNAIYGFTQLLNKEPLLLEKKSVYTKLIQENCDLLLLLIDNILDISVSETDRLSYSYEKFDVNEILADLKNIFDDINQKGIKIHFVNGGKEKSLVLYSDKVRFHQIFTNLLNNAYKFTDSGEIRFGYDEFEDFVKFFVSDTGIGIDKSEINKIFDHFYKIENNHDKFYRGTGLGLAICKKIIKLMGGEIWAESVIGKGSVFYFTLPANKSFDNYK